jgi:Fe-S oxidoreductase
MEKTVGLASERLLPPYAKLRFTTWFRRRRGRPAGAPRGAGAVSVFPTCFVEYMEPEVGRAIVEVYEHNGVECSLPEGTKCCGAPWLHSGHVEEFTKAARRNVAALAAEVRLGRDVIVAQPTCAYVVKRDYPIYAKGPDADLVASHTFDPAEYLMRRQRDADDPFGLRDEFPGRHDGTVPDAVTYHVACHLQAQNAGLRSRDLLKVAGVKCSIVQRCSGIDGTWGYRAENYDLARQVAAPLGRDVEAAGHEVVCGDCHLANGSILQETGTQPIHPMQLMARAYGLDEGGDR